MWLRFWLSIIIVIALASRMACLSLDDIHSSSQTFKSISHNNRDKSLKTAIDTIRRRRQQEYPFLNFYSLPDEELEYSERLVPISEKQDIADIPIGENSIDSEYIDEGLRNDLFSTALALKLSQLLEKNKEDSDFGHRVFNQISRKRKRSAPKHSYSKANAINAKNKNVKNGKQINGLIKTKIKRKSGRRVLNDHFNIEENFQNVINRKNQIKTNKSPTNSKNLKTKLTQKPEYNSKEHKKSITKRKVDSLLTTDLGLVNNETKIRSKEVKVIDKTMISELNDILSDDNKTDGLETKLIDTKVINKSKNNTLNDKIGSKSSVKLVSKKSKRSNSEIESLTDGKSDENESIIIYPNEVKVENSLVDEEPTNKEELDDWLRREYYETVAKTLSTMRKKRSEKLDLFSDESDDMTAIDDSDAFSENIIAIDENDDNYERENKKGSEFEKISKSPEHIDNDYVVATVDEDNNNDSNEAEDDEENDWSEQNKEEEIDKRMYKRSVPLYIVDNDESNDIDVDSQRFSKISDKLELIEDSLLNEALDLIRESARKNSESEVESNKIENRLDAAYDIEDMRSTLENLRNSVEKINDENPQINEIDEKFSLEISTPLIDTNDIKVEKKSDFVNSVPDKCSALESLSSSCELMADLVPGVRLHYSFAEACNWHQICYTCGEIYGLLSSDCDAGFLEASRLACDGSSSCESFARVVLAPLRQSRVFYKSSVPQICYQYQCIREFLFETQKR